MLQKEHFFFMVKNKVLTFFILLSLYASLILHFAPLALHPLFTESMINILKSIKIYIVCSTNPAIELPYLKALDCLGFNSNLAVVGGI